MGATLATLNEITKEVYEPSIREQLDSETVTLTRIEKTSKGVENKVGGRYVTFPIHTRRNTGIGARNELEALPQAGFQGHAAVRIGLKYLYGAAGLTGQSLALINTDYQAFQSSMEVELDGLKTDLAYDMNRQVYGDGSGKIGATTTAAASAVVAVDRPDLFQFGEAVDFTTNGTTIAKADVEVLDIDLDAGTITLDEAVTGSGFFVRTGNLNREWTGLEAIVGTDPLYNVDPATEPTWKSVINDNGGADTAISENMFTKMCDDIYVNGGKTTAIFTSLGVRRAYANLLKQQREYVNVKDFTGGFSGIGFVTDRGEVPIVVDKMAPQGTAWFLNEKALKVYREGDWSFMDMDGSKWQRKIGYDAYDTTMYQYSELGTDRRNTHGRIENITEN